MSLPESPTDPTPLESADTPSAEPLRLRYRIRFAKTGLLRWTSHRDLARLWERMIRRALLKPSMTEGFNPKPRISFPSALALGISGDNEVVELDLAERLTATELLQRLTKDDQPGLAIQSVQMLPEGSGKAKLKHTDYIITAPDPELGAAEPNAVDIQSAIDELLNKQQVTVTRKDKPLTVNVSEQILRLRFDHQIDLSLAASDAAILKPTDVLDLIGCSDWISNGSQITRTEVVLKREFETADPEFLAIANQTPHDGEPTQEVPT
ncbi:TIGR03936 family radical SAM-associated protein [Stieleria sp. TO1_6]|uniref:TIGR03936 family radical SAM-associated protein n=1 Tax=Stieleria tagensis TaxID=2956795 RepID=UPI00209AA503|nr:TIGR03936 family radical SAM-associated protein [Stieleria tagensis]MCO8123601.1 TIGR03936 family radical SAM-associated protein [Stieleria tagensis]